MPPGISERYLLLELCCLCWLSVKANGSFGLSCLSYHTYVEEGGCATFWQLHQNSGVLWQPTCLACTHHCHIYWLEWQVRYSFRSNSNCFVLKQDCSIISTSRVFLLLEFPKIFAPEEHLETI